MSRAIILLLGLFALALLIFLCVRKHTPVIQDDIQMRTSSVLSPAPTDWAKVMADGRNITLTGIAPTEALREKAAEMARAIPGVVSVDNQITVAQLKQEPTPVAVPEPEPTNIHSPYKSLFTKTASGLVLSGLVPDEEHRKTLFQMAEEKFGKGKVIDQLEIGSGAPEGWQQAAEAAISNLALFKEGTAKVIDTQLDLSGFVDGEAKDTIEAEMQKQLPDTFKVDFNLTVPQLAMEEIHPEPQEQGTVGPPCSDQFKEKLAGQKLHFSTDSADAKQAQAVISKVLKFSASCPNSIIEIAAHTDARASNSYNLRLSKNRAEAFVNKLKKRGMRADRLKAMGYGEAKPLSDNSTRKGQANNRRIEFKYLQEGE
jgi:OOP family OmpA-OmpF porin